MKQGDKEQQADLDAGMEKGGGAKATDWYPPASSSSSSVVPPGPADGGALDFGKKCSRPHAVTAEHPYRDIMKESFESSKTS